MAAGGGRAGTGYIEIRPELVSDFAKTLERDVDKKVKPVEVPVEPDTEGGGKKAADGIAGWEVAIGGAAAALGAAAGQMLMEDFTGFLATSNEGNRIAAALGLDEAGKAKVLAAGQALYADLTAGSVEEGQLAVEAVGSTLVDMSTTSKGQLIELAGAAQTVASAFGLDVTKAVADVDRLMDDLGLTAVVAMDMYAAALQKVPAELRGDFGEAVSEYAKDLYGLGYTAEEAMGVFVNGADAGKFVLDKLPDSIKEFQLKMNEGSAETRAAFAAMGMDFDDFATVLANGGPDAKNAFNYILTNLDGVASEASRRDYGTAIFGTPFEDLGPDSQKLLDALRPVNDALGQTEGKAKQMSDAMRPPTGAWDEFWRDWEIDRQNGLNRLAEDFGGSMSALAEGAGHTVDEVEMHFGDGLRVIGEFIGHYFDTVEEAFGEIPGWLGGAWEQVEDMVGKIPEALGKIFDGLESLFLDPLKTSWNVAAAWFNGLTFPTMGPWDIDAGPLGSFTIGPYGGWDLPDLPTFDKGGVVPGTVGSPQLILAHGGETVLPTHKPGGGMAGGVTVNQTINTVASPSEVAQVSTALLMRRIRPR